MKAFFRRAAPRKNSLLGAEASSFERALAGLDRLQKRRLCRAAACKMQRVVCTERTWGPTCLLAD